MLEVYLYKHITFTKKIVENTIGDLKSPPAVLCSASKAFILEIYIK